MATKKYATGFPLASSAALTDQIQAVKSGVDNQETLQQVLDLFNKQGVSITATGGSSYPVSLSNNKGLIYNPLSAVALTLTLPTNAQDNTLPQGFYCYVMNPPGNVENITITAGSDTLVGGATIIPGSIALIVKSVYGTPNVWLVSYLSSQFPLPIYLGGTNASTAADARTNLGLGTAATQNTTTFLQVANNLSDVQSLSTTQTNLQITGTQNMPLWFQPTNSNGGVANQAAFANGVNIPYVQFPDAAISYSYAIAQMPKRWNQSTFQLLFGWYTPATSGNVLFKADAAIIQLGSSLNLTFGTAVSVTSPAAATANAPTNILTSAITPSGFASDWSWIVIRIYRDGTDGSDTLANNAFIINPVRQIWTASAGNDA